MNIEETAATAAEQFPYWAAAGWSVAVLAAVALLVATMGPQIIRRRGR